MSRSAVARLSEVLAPRVCAGCGLPGDALCAACLASMDSPPWPRCGRCGHPQPLTVDGCPECRRSLAWSRQAVRYDALPAAVMRAFKDHGRRDLAVPLARLVVARCPPPPADAVLVPVPLGERRRRRRGYNQSALIAAVLAEVWGVPVAEGLLVRCREEPPQRGAGRTARARQAAGAFSAVPGPTDPRHVWLVDDVVTTGATLNACAAALRRGGAGRVCAVAVARAVRP